MSSKDAFLSGATLAAVASSSTFAISKQRAQAYKRSVETTVSNIKQAQEMIQQVICDALLDSSKRPDATALGQINQARELLKIAKSTAIGAGEHRLDLTKSAWETEALIDWVQKDLTNQNQLTDARRAASLATTAGLLKKANGYHMALFATPNSPTKKALVIGGVVAATAMGGILLARHLASGRQKQPTSQVEEQSAMGKNVATGMGGIGANIQQVQGKVAALGGDVSNRVLNAVDRNGILAKVSRNKAVKITNELVQAAKAGVSMGAVSLAAGQMMDKKIQATLAKKLDSYEFDELREEANRASLGLGLGLTTFGVIKNAYLFLGHKTYLQADKSNGPVEVVEPIAYSRLSQPTPIWPKNGDPTSTVFSIPFKNLAGGTVYQHWQKRSWQINGHPVTTLRANALLGDEYHFTGPLSHKEAVEIAVGMRAPYQIPDYIGTVSKTEKLSPSWALFKRSLIYSSAAGGK